MPAAESNALRATHRFLRVLIVLNVLAGLAILALLVASLVAPEPVIHALGARPAPGNAARIAGMRLIAVLGLAAVPVAQVVLGRLLAVVDTVRAGDPFVLENAGRLRSIAWAVLGMELIHIAIGVTAEAASSETAPLDIEWGFAVTRWLAVLLLFVLAQVFEHGAGMREDLEGTV